MPACFGAPDLLFSCSRKLTDYSTALTLSFLQRNVRMPQSLKLEIWLRYFLPAFAIVRLRYTSCVLTTMHSMPWHKSFHFANAGKLLSSATEATEYQWCIEWIEVWYMGNHGLRLSAPRWHFLNRLLQRRTRS